MDVFALSEAVRERKVSPVELVAQTLAAIESKNDQLNAYITICAEDARKEAAQAEADIMRGEWRGMWHGIPVAVKDMILTAGVRTTLGSKVFERFVPEQDATVVRKWKEAGAIVLGKTNTHEFAYGPTGDKSHFGPSRNPHNPQKITGGSSSGSGAAVAANLAYAALGTDTGGSVRIPAAACGIVGMKPTFGLVSKYGAFDLGYTLDHVGPMTQSVRDNAGLLNLLAGYDHNDPYSLSWPEEDYARLLGTAIRGKVIGVPHWYYQHVEGEIVQALQQVMEVYRELGAEVREVELSMMDELVEAQRITVQAEASAVHEKTLRDYAADLDQEVCERLLDSKEVRGYQYVQVQQRRGRLTASYNEVFAGVDVLLTPTLPILPTDIGQRTVMIGDYQDGVRPALLRLTAPTNFTGNPSLSVPCGFSKDGLPIGFQLIGKHGEEAKLYQFGYAYEQETRS
ncbi:Asp-tRNA(Asn)/Glu-tRNA(Gln) amidotransferase GatCAB subunit A [Brevibacillus borstelensis]|uniref:Asp-tRNA(Asn)/Glu-tRNA(Gln) amidotransferase GatCAB subunit A n=1 Tax=Brevibacillus borstelensis TaxID=45462 RepID=UPI0004F2FC94|nr:Asp-tRNA(Asn)/Glu-tRNA(Gln) amidotransferase GatCAB subunit A [Brevibacillus borstelensis]KKX57142.1 glutamyl-tRNA amidotransferase [Brevibacillus borstelensis cifa_chp40]